MKEKIKDKNLLIDNEKLFLSSYIPRTLNNMDAKTLEEEMNKLFTKKDVFYDKLTGLQTVGTGGAEYQPK